jgi:hypothetical protein
LSTIIFATESKHAITICDEWNILREIATPSHTAKSWNTPWTNPVCFLKYNQTDACSRGQVYTLDKAVLHGSAHGIKLRFVKSVDLTPGMHDLVEE